MPVTDDFILFVSDQLEEMEDVHIQEAFGQGLVSSEGVNFGFIIDDTLYLKVDESNRPDYEEAGATAWVYADKRKERRSYGVPAHVLEDSETLVVWATRSLAAARRWPPVK